MIKQRRLLDVEKLRMQMAMIAYSTLDTFDEKQRVIAKSKEESREAPVESTYLGLISQTFISTYELDIYAHISLTNLKFLIFKNESRLNPVKVNASERHMRMIIDNIHKFYTKMLLNPFFDLSWVKDAAALALHETSAFADFEDEDDEMSSGSGSSRSSQTSRGSMNSMEDGEMVPIGMRRDSKERRDSQR